MVRGKFSSLNITEFYTRTHTHTHTQTHTHTHPHTGRIVGLCILILVYLLYLQFHPWSCSTAVYKLVWHIPLLSLQWINSWWWTYELSETCRVSWQNTFVKLMRLVGFFTKKKVNEFYRLRKNYTCEKVQTVSVQLVLQFVPISLLSLLSFFALTWANQYVSSSMVSHPASSYLFVCLFVFHFRFVLFGLSKLGQHLSKMVERLQSLRCLTFDM
jgi:hypothetical protein